MVNFIITSSYGNNRGEFNLSNLIIAVLALIGVLLAAVEIYNHYKTEKRRIRRQYDLYRVCFIADGGIYTQIIGGKSEEDVKQLIYSTYTSASEVLVVSIEPLQQSKSHTN